MMRQELRLEQRMLLTPQLLMNLKLLQMPVMELEMMVLQELETNPALEEMTDEAEPESATSETEAESTEAQSPEETPAPAADLLDTAENEKTADEKTEIKELESALDKGDIALADFLQDDGYLPPEPLSVAPDDREMLEVVADDTVCVADIILPMVKSRVDPADYPIAEAIMDNLNEDGFLLISRDELAQHLDMPQERVDRVLYVVQHLEAGGIGARTIREALILQLEVMGYAPESVEYRMLAECYEMLTKRQYAHIARELDTTEERVREAVEEISRLEPKPCRKYGSTNPGYVRPDFTVEWRGDELTFYATDDSTPRIRISSKYRDMLLNPKTYAKEQVDFARKKAQGALMMIKGIESRKRTLNRVMRYLLERQHDFFVNGREYLRPIRIKDTGGALGIHPSTISRAVQNKYVETPYAILPMRFFFTSGTAGKARHSVKDRIRRVVEEEDKDTPYSDEEIGEILEKEGVKLSRRTVAKYRGEMDIPGCNERRDK
jgi:RNA polymerase sigma-54 factor